MILNLDEKRLACNRVLPVPVRCVLSRRSLVHVRLELHICQLAKHEVGMNHQNLTTNLSESKALQKSSLETVRVQRAVQEYDVRAVAQLRINVVSVTVARHDAREHRLDQTI